MRIILPMSDDRKPNPMDDVSKGLDLLFRAAGTVAKSAVDRVEKLPSDNLENFVREGAKEVAHALEAVGNVIDREVLGHRPPTTPPAAGASGSAPTAGAPVAPSADAKPADAPAASGQETPPGDDAPKGPRVG
jgi:hypothetical protein